MTKILTIKEKQIEELKRLCTSNNIDYESITRLIQAERVKMLQTRNHYIQQTINSEIENILKNENK